MIRKILVVDDDISNLELLSTYLSNENFEVTTSCDGSEGINIALKQDFDLILLDIMMPKIDGYQFIKMLRKTSETPVIFLTARDDQHAVNQGFLLGCDDYLVKPFDLTELKLRINALLKRSTADKTVKNKDSNSVEIIKYKDLVINKASHEVIKGDDLLSFTSKEFQILLLLLSNPNRVYSAKNIYDIIWDDVYFVNDKAVLTHIGNIREKLGDTIQTSKYIKTIWGVGYKVE